MGFLGRLLASDDRSVDSMGVGALAALAAMIVLSGYSVIHLHHEFNELTFGGGAGGILTLLGAGRNLRDRVTPPAQSTQP